MAYFEKIREDNETLSFRTGDCSFPAHFHKNIEFLYAFEQGLEVLIDNEKFILEKNQLLFIDAYSVHHILSTQPAISLCLPIVFCEDWFNYKENREFKSIVFADDDEFLKNILNRFSSFETDNYLIKKSKADLLLGTLAERGEFISASSKDSNNMVRRAVEYLNKNYNNRLDLNSVAKKIGYGKYTLSHNFKKKTGLDLREYLTQIRLNELVAAVKKQKAKGKDFKLTELVFEIGFESMPTFYRAFKKRFNVTPKQYFLRVYST